MERSRSSWFTMANESIFRVSDCGSSTLDISNIKLYFSNWYSKYSRGYSIRLRKSERYLFIRAVNRFMAEYRSKIWSKFSCLDDVQWEQMLTLTLDPKGFMNLGAQFVFINKAWNKLRTALVKKFGKFDFVRVLEIQKSGRPHLHILMRFGYNMAAAYFRCVRDFIDDLWLRKYRGGFSKLRTCFDGFKACSYVVKYVKKSLAIDDDDAYAALLFASNKRLFSFSLRLDKSPMCNSNKVEPMAKSNSDDKWVFDGSVGSGVVVSFCAEYGLVYGNMVFVDWDLKYLQKWKDLFGIED